MTKMKKRSGAAQWLTPLAFALPFAAAVAFALMTWGQKISDLISIVVKMAVIS